MKKNEHIKTEYIIPFLTLFNDRFIRKHIKYIWAPSFSISIQIWTGYFRVELSVFAESVSWFSWQCTDFNMWTFGCFWPASGSLTVWPIGALSCQRQLRLFLEPQQGATWTPDSESEAHAETEREQYQIVQDSTLVRLNMDRYKKKIETEIDLLLNSEWKSLSSQVCAICSD